MKVIILLTLVLLAVIFGASRVMVSEKRTGFSGLFESFPTNNPTLLPTPNLVSIPLDCSGQVTPDITEGPYYKENSPERINLQEDGTPGEKFTLTGYVFDKNCKPLIHAWIDFWQADVNGLYDDVGFKLRGHQFTDSQGMYRLETIIPGQYTTRTPHIHAKVQANPVSPFAMTQLYFPAETRNREDPIFSEATIIKINNSGAGKMGTYNFVVEKKE